MDILERLNAMLKARDWTRYRLSKESGLTESTLANIFQRNAMPSLDTLERICAGFGITLSQFFADGEMVELTPELKEVFDAGTEKCSVDNDAGIQSRQLIEEEAIWCFFLIFLPNTTI